MWREPRLWGTVYANARRFFRDVNEGVRELGIENFTDKGTGASGEERKAKKEKLGPLSRSSIALRAANRYE